MMRQFIFTESLDECESSRMTSLIPWFVLLLLLVPTVSVHGDEEEENIDDIKFLEVLEDYIVRDGNIQAYIKHEGAGHGPNCRTPENLLRQFKAIETTPAAVRKVKKLWKKLDQEDSSLTKHFPKYEMQKIRSAITDALGRVAVSIRKHCDDTVPYRSIDGTCNNLDNPERGSAGTPLLRVVDNAYDDGISSPRTASLYKGSLPSAREVSRRVFDAKTKQKRGLTSFVVHFGQLIDHDLDAVETQQSSCNGCEVQNECFPIKIKEKDRVFGGVQKCFPFVRSDHDSDSPGVRQQLNSITTWLDASFVYGSDEKSAMSLIDDDKPFLLKHLTDEVTERDLLPPNKDLEACASIDEDANIFCGLAGDGRAAEQPGLTSLHTVFLREHNRIAKELQNLNEDLGDQEIYQIARRVVGAEWQHIVYNEYLPHITGADLYKSAKLGTTDAYKYDPDVDASIANEFAAAAFRFGHTMVPDTILRVNKNYKKTRKMKEIQMREAFFNASYVFDTSIPNGAVDSILRGMTVQKLDVVDEHLSSAITENLFGNPDEKGDGFDLASLNIQRGRDHGIPSYVEIREKYCGFAPIRHYRDLKTFMTWKNINALKRVYGKRGLKDIDAFAGLILEKHLPNTLVGPTLACIFADQFRRLKFGDRFFYKNPDQFTSAEMEEIEKVTMARLMCDNIEGVSRIQPYVFVQKWNFKKSKYSGNRKYASFYKYSRSGFWPHKKSHMLSGMNNRQVKCKRTGRIPRMDLSIFITRSQNKHLNDYDAP